MLQNNLTCYIDEGKLEAFLGEVFRLYKNEVQYHNDLHGIDVAQMAHLFLTDGDLVSALELDAIDVVSLLTASICHDLAHDGLTNGYHVNASTMRALRYNDVSVQENFHLAETFSALSKTEFNFLEKLTVDQYKICRKRIIGCILATDMAKHASDLGTLKSLVEIKQIKAGVNKDKIINRDDCQSVFKSQQFILECCIHASDIS